MSSLDVDNFDFTWYDSDTTEVAHVEKMLTVSEVATMTAASKKPKKLEPADKIAKEIVTPQVTPIRMAPWHGVITMEGVESGDGRMFNAGGLTWDKPPLPLMWQKETSHGGTPSNVSVRVGNIDRIWREPAGDGNTTVNKIMGQGTLDLGNPDGREVFRRMRGKYMSGNSVDVDSVNSSNIELRYAPIEPSADPEDAAQDLVQSLFAEPELTVYHAGRIRATTLCEIPAFTEARISLVDIPDDAVSFADVDEIEMRGVELVAAASVIEITDAPPREWFEEPTDVNADGALTITSEGRIYGYVAPSGVRHRSFPDRQQYVPLGNVDYSRFMSGQTITADGGRIATGALTMNCGHASTTRSLTASQASEHYDNSCSIVATARVGENRNGVWMAGALMPGLAPATLQRIMACKLSGDWRAHLDRPGWREFVAALLVPVPGFPMARKTSSLRMDEGQLVASSVPVMLAVSNESNIDTPDAGDLNTAARREAAQRGWAMDDGSYPIRDEAHHGLDDLDKAIHAVGRGNAPHDRIRRHIIKRAMSLGASDRIPANWKPSGKLAAGLTANVEALARRTKVARLRASVAAAKMKRKC